MPKDVTCSPHTWTHTRTHIHTHRVTTVGTLSGFQDVFLQPIIKDRPSMAFFSNYFLDLKSENPHMIIKGNALNPNMIPHVNASELWNVFISHI